MMEKLYELKRGTVCELMSRDEMIDVNARVWMTQNVELCDRLYTSQQRFLLVMKLLPGDMLLVTFVYDRLVRNTRRISVNGERYWVKYDEFFVIPSALVMAAAGKKLDRRVAAVTGIYETHTRHVQRR